MGFFTMLGYISTLDLSHLEEISGASAGAILGLMLCLNWSCDEILKFSLDLDIASHVKPNLTKIFTNYGLTSIDQIKNKLFEIVHGGGYESLGRLGPVTFQDFYKKTNKKFYVTAFCVDTGLTKYFSVDTHPDMCVIQAIAMSIAVPLLFEAIKYDECFYVDGGLVENSPMKVFIDKEDTLGLTLNSFQCEKIENFKSFFTKLINSCRRVTNYNCKILNTTGNIFNFSMSNSDKYKMFLEGIGS